MVRAAESAEATTSHCLSRCFIQCAEATSWQNTDAYTILLDNDAVKQLVCSQHSVTISFIFTRTLL
ncbi:hypothetical protein Taro_048811 [Colocasia esculenta]|uniref:Uncharacterized protein n=1 Tax=Colocasia esculenta TaxID=4460 RepID=A0A843X9A3_COLES|nr:hypothetical protein [Colocasia esculenta]